MGRSIHDIGPRLRWSDVGTIVRHLPPTSHFVRQQNPEREAAMSYGSPEAQMLSLVVDEVTRLRMTIRGVPVDAWPEPLMQRLEGVSRSGSSGGGVVEKQSPPRRRGAHTASEARAMLAAARNR